MDFVLFVSKKCLLHWWMLGLLARALKDLNDFLSLFRDWWAILLTRSNEKSLFGVVENWAEIFIWFIITFGHICSLEPKEEIEWDLSRRRHGASRANRPRQLDQPVLKPFQHQTSQVSCLPRDMDKQYHVAYKSSGLHQTRFPRILSCTIELHGAGWGTHMICLHVYLEVHRDHFRLCCYENTRAAGEQISTSFTCWCEPLLVPNREEQAREGVRAPSTAHGQNINQQFEIIDYNHISLYGILNIRAWALRSVGECCIVRCECTKRQRPDRSS